MLALKDLKFGILADASRCRQPSHPCLLGKGARSASTMTNIAAALRNDGTNRASFR